MKDIFLEVSAIDEDSTTRTGTYLVPVFTSCEDPYGSITLDTTADQINQDRGLHIFSKTNFLIFQRLAREWGAAHWREFRFPSDVHRAEASNVERPLMDVEMHRALDHGGGSRGGVENPGMYTPHTGVFRAKIFRTRPLPQLGPASLDLHTSPNPNPNKPQ